MTTSPLQKRIDALPFPVGAGILVWPLDGGYYVSDAPAPPGAWSELRGEHRRSGLWPVFLQCHESASSTHWNEGWAGFRWSNRLASDDETYDAAAVLERQWHEFGPEADATAEELADYAAQRAPFAREWPGPAPAIEIRLPPDEVADDFAERLINDPHTRLGLVPVDRGADVPRATGWWASEEISPGAVSAVLRSWEDRFGARLIRIGFNTMVVSVAAPPTTLPDAHRVAAEHLAFCQENVGYPEGALARYAEDLIGANHWAFWWERDSHEWIFDE